jgi:hypothetical protein
MTHCVKHHTPSGRPWPAQWPSLAGPIPWNRIEILETPKVLAASGKISQYKRGMAFFDDSGWNWVTLLCCGPDKAALAKRQGRATPPKREGGVEMLVEMSGVAGHLNRTVDHRPNVEA